jgi:hypothetical protein
MVRVSNVVLTGVVYAVMVGIVVQKGFLVTK